MSKFKTFLYDERQAQKHLRVASVCMQCDLDPQVNRTRMVDRIDAISAAHPDVDLIMFGETILGWYSKPGASKAYHRSIAETIPGETTELMSHVARDKGVYLSFGMSELRDQVYNAQVLIDPQGEIVAVHRKMNLRDDVFAPGTMYVTVVDIKGVKTGIVICYDVQSIRVARELKRNDPELILLSLADDKDEGWFGAGFHARLYDSWIVTANRFGDEGGHYWNGHTVISNPVGELRVREKDAERYVYYEIGFVTDQSVLKKVLRKACMRADWTMYLLKHLGIALDFVQDRIRVLKSR